MTDKLGAVTCRLMRPEELPTVAELHYSVLDYPQFEKRVRKPDVAVLVAERNGEIVGYIMLRSSHSPRNPERKALKLVYVGVRPDSRSLGVGSQMLDWVKQKLSAEGYAFAYLEIGYDEPRAPEFYAKNGFVWCTRMHSHMCYPNEPADFFNEI